VFVSRKRVIRIMQQEGLKARVRKRCGATTMSDHDQPVAPNILDRQLTAEKLNQRWVGDTTRARRWQREAVPRRHARPVLELRGRRALSPSNDRFLTMRALDTAIRRRRPDAGLLHRSDLGRTYASEDHQ
jgi:transposase InsO family protein